MPLPLIATLLGGLAAAHLSLADVQLVPPGTPPPDVLPGPVAPPPDAEAGATVVPLAAAAADRDAPAWLRITGEMLTATTMDIAAMGGALTIAEANQCTDYCPPRGPGPGIGMASLLVGANVAVPLVVWLIARNGRGASSSLWAAMLGHFVGQAAGIGAAFAANGHDTTPLILGMALPALGTTLGAELSRSTR